MTFEPETFFLDLMEIFSILLPGMLLPCRQKHNDALQRAREKLGWMARRIETEPWSDEFTKELEHKAIPNIADVLIEPSKVRDEWLKSGRGRSVLKAAGVAVGTAAAVLAFFPTPLTRIALATVGLGLASGTAIPGLEWLLDWRDGRKTGQVTGLHYLLAATCTYQQTDGEKP
jgi:hypothetical protein